MSDVYAPSNSPASQARLLNRSSDLKPITDADVATGAAIAYSKTRQWIGRLKVPVDATGVFRDFYIRHNLNAVPTFVSVTPIDDGSGGGAASFMVKKITKDVVVLNINTDVTFSYEFMVKVEA